MGLNKTADILQGTYSNTCSCLKLVEVQPLLKHIPLFFTVNNSAFDQVMICSLTVEILLRGPKWFTSYYVTEPRTQLNVLHTSYVTMQVQ